MKHPIRALLCSVALIASGCAATPASGPQPATAALTQARTTPAGDWHGTFEVPPGAKLRIGIHVDETSPGVFAGTVASPDQGHVQQPDGFCDVGGRRLHIQTQVPDVDPANGTRRKTPGSANTHRPWASCRWRSTRACCCRWRQPSRRRSRWPLGGQDSGHDDHRRARLHRHQRHGGDDGFANAKPPTSRSPHSSAKAQPSHSRCRASWRNIPARSAGRRQDKRHLRSEARRCRSSSSLSPRM